MPTPDLPPELWFEILSYLPRFYVYRMMGINRTLFRIAMELKYEEVSLITDDEDALRFFEQLRHTNVANLVKRLHLRPAFLPAMDHAFQGDEDEEVATSFSWFKQMLPTNKPRDGAAEESKILSLARDVLPNCHNLQELNIIIYDHIIHDTFRDFLHHIWRIMGANIQRLILSTTINKVPDLFSLIAQHAPQLPNLETLDLTVVNSRFPRQKDTVDLAVDAIVGLIHRFKGSLTQLIFSSVTEFDHALLFSALDTLPKLRKLELWFVFCDQTISDRGMALNKFLSYNSQTLECLVLKTRPRFDSFFLSLHTETHHQWVLNQLPKLVLPQVKTLDLGLRTLIYNAPSPSSAPIRLPLLPPIFPQLRTLILSEVSLHIKGLEHVLDQTRGKLQRLECLVWTFTPEMLTLLATKAPQLTSLTLSYQSLEGSGTYARIQAARYPHWRLAYLRIGLRRDTCGQCHPDSFLAKIIRESLSEDVEIDVGVRCECYGTFRERLAES